MDNTIAKLIDNISQVIIGKQEVIRQLLITYLCEGHILLEGDPGLGKTKLALAMVRSIEGEVNRIQFTPDILPSDVTGYGILNRQTNEIEYKKGAVFCNFLLADEINRASPRVQSSLLEAMEERQVTVEGSIRKLPSPFMVIATQNTIEQEGTYPLPEAQLDRFFMKLVLEYPTHKEWEQILNMSEEKDPLKDLKCAVSIEEIKALKQKLGRIIVSQPVKNYIIELAEAIRRHEAVQTGVSPRGTIALLKASRGNALMEGRDYVLPDDVQKMLIPVTGHRIVLLEHAKWKNINAESLIQDIMQTVTVPVIQ